VENADLTMAHPKTSPVFTGNVTATLVVLGKIMISLDISTHSVTTVKLNSGVIMSGSLFLSGKRKMDDFP